MQLIDGRPVYAATDLVGFLACAHLTDLERAAIARLVTRPERIDPQLDRIRQRGFEHEQRYLSELERAGRTVRRLDDSGSDPWTDDRGERFRTLAARTVDAIERGEDVIFQACFFDGTWLGFADFLLRVERPTTRLGWSYEVADTKLARSVKASAVLQLCSYNEQLTRIQGGEAESMHIVLGGSSREQVTLRLTDYAAYYRTVKRLFDRTVSAPLPVAHPPPAPSYPDPVEHCQVCRWWQICADRRRADDDLSLVAGIAGRTRTELKTRGIGSRRAFAGTELPLVPRLDRTGGQTLLRMREQARIQVEGKDLGTTIFERLAPVRLDDGTLDPSKGLLALPMPSPNDLFLDLEGDPFALEDGVDYLFGILEPGRLDANGQPTFHRFWSRDEDGNVTPDAERRAFEATMDLIVEKLAADPSLHVYHFAPYEPTALGRIMGRYATRQVEVERLMRGDTLIDLYQVTRQGVRASVESYSIKKLEPLYGYEREVDLRDAGSSIVAFETWLEVGGEAGGDDGTLERIERYNRDDVVSTWQLRDWLESRRLELEADLGERLPRPGAKSNEEPEKVADWLRRVREVSRPLLDGVPDDETDRRDDPAVAGRWLLAQLLGWHRRELRPAWWRYYQLLDDLTDEERVDEREPIGLLEPVGWEDEAARTYRYRFPPQEHDVRDREVVDPMQRDGKRQPSFPAPTFAEAADELVLRFPKGRPIIHPRSLVPNLVFTTDEQEGSLLRIGESVVAGGIDGDGPYRAARDLLMRRPPRIVGLPSGAPLRTVAMTAEEAARDLVMRLDETTLAIQGPPGTGKTWTGARMILDLVAAGKRVGVTSNGHKVIGKLLDDVWEAARSDSRFVDRPIRIGQKPGSREAVTCPHAETLKENEHVRAALDARTVDVVGGTAWLWAREDMMGRMDVLFIDEAGQFSLANAVAVSPAAASLVMLGDPQQLNQPIQGTHPPGAEGSALAHLLDGSAVMPPDRGLFMEKTWRLHPDICVYTSEVFYEGKLEAERDNARQDLAGRGVLDGTGIRFLGIDHEHARNDTDSPEEAAAIGELVADLLAGGATWTDARGDERPITPEDILIVAPYNLHRRGIAAALKARGELPSLVPVGTVDKFQGQQAPISIYSMASSTAEDAPRGMEFLYSLNRLNVATSRARCLTLVVASPALVRVRARTRRQMELANALCRLVEVAR
jgi:predicted RecB family nuclease